ncbi:MAG: glutathione S-transferase family protein [Beijerinckiaceae bacterium]|nr:glutathione S-transferase family protein [Beijerinckiaceae bacterium]
MIDLYAWGTTNGRRALVMAEEAGLPFTLHQINIQKGDQKTPEYGMINPHRKIPALVDSDGPGGQPAVLFESVAICFYLAEKTGRFLGSATDHPDVLKWSMFHATNVLATFGNLGRIDHPSFEQNALSQLDTMNRHLEGREWFAGEYSIADIIPFTRIVGVNHERVKTADFANVAAWLARVGARPAVRRAMEQKFG